MEPMPRADGGSERVQTGRSVFESQHHVCRGREETVLTGAQKGKAPREGRQLSVLKKHRLWLSNTFSRGMKSRSVSPEDTLVAVGRRQPGVRLQEGGRVTWEGVSIHRANLVQQ